MVGLVQDCLPIKMKQIYILNPPFIFAVIKKMMRPFMKQKLIDRICPIPKSEIGEHFESTSLPPELGGTFPGDFWEMRAAGLKLRQQSIAEFEVKAQQLLKPQA
mmetsp:Transcript_34766/g.54317  ORF Transcript_34766/g.54317 Transcript_34766/m.54317 type:complete len:104 (+) Transcript_34766:102-413(+)